VDRRVVVLGPAGPAVVGHVVVVEGEDHGVAQVEGLAVGVHPDLGQADAIVVEGDGLTGRLVGAGSLVAVVLVDVVAQM
jgi:hypothetical protein